MSTMHVELVSVERRIWSGEAEAVFARTTDGELGVYPGHAPVLAALAPGWVVRIARESEQELRVAVDGGFLSVDQSGVSVLAETAQLSDEIDVAEARAELSAADPETDSGRVARDRALARLRAAGESV